MCTAGVDPNSHSVIPVFTRLILTKFSGFVGVWDGFIKRSFILRLLKGHCMFEVFPPKYFRGIGEKNSMWVFSLGPTPNLWANCVAIC